MAFLGHIPDGNNKVVDHIDFDKTNNELENLKVVTTRENLSKDKWRYNPSSYYTGVSFNKAKKKWEVSIFIKGKSRHLGYYQQEDLAGYKYFMALNQISECAEYQD